MRMSKAELLDLIASGDYYVIQRKDDRNSEDIRIERQDGAAAEIINYPYRINKCWCIYSMTLYGRPFFEKTGSMKTARRFSGFPLKGAKRSREQPE